MKSEKKQSLREWAAGVNPDELSLSSLTLISEEQQDAAWKALQESKKRREEFRKKYEPIYGERWLDMYYEQEGIFKPIDYSRHMKLINTWIYKGRHSLFCTGGPEFWAIVGPKFTQREHEIYGERYDELRNHRFLLEEAGEWLIQDALKTGKWKELPDELQAEYHRRVGGTK